MWPAPAQPPSAAATTAIQAAKKNSPHRFAINGNAIRACSLLYRNPKNDRRATMMTMAPTI
jgi:hypothetical protein